MDITTYNRVEHLEKAGIKRLLLSTALLFLAAGAWGLADLVYSDSPWITSLTWPNLSFLLALALTVITLKRKEKCRFCGNRLETVKRPFQYKNEHLFGDGLLVDGEIFAQAALGLMPFRKRWCKLYHWSRTCHHCRIYENTHHEASTPATEAELEKIRQINGGG